MIYRMLMMAASNQVSYENEGVACYLSTEVLNNNYGGLLLSDDNNYAYFSGIGIDLYSRNTATGILTFVSTTTFSNEFASGIYDSDMVITSDGLYLFSLSANSTTSSPYLNKFTRNVSTGAITFDSQTALNSSGVSLKFNADKTKLYVATRTEFKRYSVSSGVLTLDWSGVLNFIDNNYFHNMKIGSFIITNTNSFSILLCSSDFNSNPSPPYTSGYKNQPFLKVINNSDGSSVNVSVPSNFFLTQYDYDLDSSLAKCPTGNFIVFTDVFLDNNVIKYGVHVATVENDGSINTVEIYYGNDFNQFPYYVFNSTGRILFTASNGNASNFNLTTGHLTYFESVPKPERLVISKDNDFIYGLNNNQEYLLYTLGIPCPCSNELLFLTSTAIPLYGATLVITGTGRASNDYIWTITPNAGSSGNFGCDLTYTIPSTPALESIFAPPSVPTISFLQANLGSPNSSTLIVELISNVYPYGGIMSSGNNYPIYAGDSLRIIYYGNQFVSGWNESYFRFSSNIADCT